ncbi:MAG: hypothetical protein QW331_00735 [Candidatus Woesearchaeota archaeon]
MQIEAAQQTEQRGIEKRVVPFKQKRILLVDDDPLLLGSSQEMLLKYMRREGEFLYAVSSGIMGISTLRAISMNPAKSLTHIITDLAMPYWNGEDIIREARELEFDKRFGTEFYIFSTNESEGSAAAARVGAQFIYKPILPVGKEKYRISRIAISNLYRAIYGTEFQRKVA